MADEAVVQRTHRQPPPRRQMGYRQSAIRAIDRALSDLFPEDHSRTSTEKRLVKDIHSLTKNDHLHAAELRVLERIVGHIKAVIYERANSN
jgi:hypothetical protein